MQSMRNHILFQMGISLLMLGLFGGQPLAGQMAGSRRNEDRSPPGAEQAERQLSPEVATKYIVVQGTAQRNVRPSELRLIWAVTAEDAEPARCRQLLQQQIKTVCDAWNGIGINANDIVEDFISAIPKYEWMDEQRGDKSFVVEKKTGYRIQSNLHVRAANEKQALQIVDAALSAGVTDLIGVDYMADLSSIQVEARTAALEAAKNKSSQLLSLVFAKTPAPINVSETSIVHFPPELYKSFENVASEEYTTRYDDNRSRIFAYRPKNTYYQGLTAAADDRRYELPMSPEIIVESTVQLYYLSPAATQLGDEKPKAAEKPPPQ